MKVLLVVVSVLALTGITMAPASASSKKDSAMQKEAEQVMEDGGNPHLRKLEEKTREIGDPLDKFALAHLYTMREAYGVLEAVRVVRRDVDVAVKACGKANPDLRTPMNDRFKGWSSAIDPVVKAKQADIDAAIKAQTYTKAKDINDYFTLIRKTAEHANAGIEKDVVTTPEACSSLLASMDKTQDVISGLLSEMTLLPWPPEEPAVSTPAAPRTNN